MQQVGMKTRNSNEGTFIINSVAWIEVVINFRQWLFYFRQWNFKQRTQDTQQYKWASVRHFVCSNEFYCFLRICLHEMLIFEKNMIFFFFRFVLCYHLQITCKFGKNVWRHLSHNFIALYMAANENCKVKIRNVKFIFSYYDQGLQRNVNAVS